LTEAISLRFAGDEMLPVRIGHRGRTAGLRLAAGQ
jgi:hypothetical protein